MNFAGLNLTCAQAAAVDMVTSSTSPPKPWGAVTPSVRAGRSGKIARSISILMGGCNVASLREDLKVSGRRKSFAVGAGARGARRPVKLASKKCRDFFSSPHGEQGGKIAAEIRNNSVRKNFRGYPKVEWICS